MTWSEQRTDADEHEHKRAPQLGDQLAVRVAVRELALPDEARKPRGARPRRRRLLVRRRERLARRAAQ